MAKKTKLKEDSKTFAFLAVFLSIVGFIIALLTKKDDKYVMYYAKESLVLFIASVILYIAGGILTVITLGIFGIVMFLVWLFIMVLWVIQIINSFSGEMRSTPIIGQYAKVSANGNYIKIYDYFSSSWRTLHLNTDTGELYWSYSGHDYPEKFYLNLNRSPTSYRKKIATYNKSLKSWLEQYPEYNPEWKKDIIQITQCFDEILARQ